jgi:hypothetical protein
MQLSSRRTNSPGKEWHYSSVGRKNSPGAIFPSDGRIDSTGRQTAQNILAEYEQFLRDWEIDRSLVSIIILFLTISARHFILFYV